MDRAEARDLLQLNPEVTADGSSDMFRYGVFCPEVITTTFDPDNRLLKVVQLLAGGHEIHFLE